MKKKSNNLTNSVRFLGVDMVAKANSGHTGICLGAAQIITELYTKHLVATAKKSDWINRDRFVMAVGHGSALFYSILHHMGYDISLDQVKNFRQYKSKTPGHPEFGHTDGVDATTGPLGQGIAQAVGMALAEKILAFKYNKEDLRPFNHYTYVLTSDGDIQEGVAYEAMSFAGHYGLKKLIVLYDSNDYQLDGAVTDAFSEDIKKRCESQNWHYQLVKNGSSQSQIASAIRKAKTQLDDKPSFIEIKTILGEGTTMANSSATHGAPISDDEREIAAKYFNHKESPFVFSDEVKKELEEIKAEKVEQLQEWQAIFDKYKKKYPKEYQEIITLFNRDFKVNLTKIFKPDLKLKPSATRNYLPEIIEKVSKLIPTMFGGSGDVAKSTKVEGVGGDLWSSDENNNFSLKNGHNINYGVREFAMTAISNGMLLHGGIVPFASSYFVFTDYGRPAFRLAAIQNLPAIHIYSHDSIAVGEDGPTHQPVEQLSSFRAMPNINLVRPADRWETILAFNQALKEKTRPTLIVTSRQSVKNVSCVKESQFVKGAYIIQDCKVKKPRLTIIATGSEVSLVLEAVKLVKDPHKIRVVSMPSMHNFNNQTKAYQSKIICDKSKTLFVELSDGSSCYKYADHVKSLNSFGQAGTCADLMQHYGFTPKQIKNHIEKLTKKPKKKVVKNDK